MDITGQTGKVCFCLFMGGLYNGGMNPGQPPKLLDQVRALMRVRLAGAAWALREVA